MDALDGTIVTLSLALSVKMNILLVAPAFGLLLLLNTGLLQTARYGILIVALQVRPLCNPLYIANRLIGEPPLLHRHY